MSWWLQLQSHTNPQLLSVSDQGSPDMLPMISSMTFTASASDAFKSSADSGSILPCLSRANSALAKNLSTIFRFAGTSNIYVGVWPLYTIP